MVGCDERNFDVDCEECCECSAFDECWHKAGEEEHADAIRDELAEHSDEDDIYDEMSEYYNSSFFG